MGCSIIALGYTSSSSIYVTNNLPRDGVVVYKRFSSRLCGGGATGSDRVRMRNRQWRHRKRPWAETVLTGTGSDRMRMRNRYILYRLCMTDCATGSDVIPKGGRVCACGIGSWYFPPFFLLFWREMKLPVGINAPMRNRKLGFPTFFVLFFRIFFPSTFFPYFFFRFPALFSYYSYSTTCF